MKKTPKQLKANRRAMLKQKYGISLEVYHLMHQHQNGVCAICGQTDKRSLSVDHDHKTNKVRGLLCRKCNVGLGYFQDSKKLLTMAIKYLDGHY